MTFVMGLSIIEINEDDCGDTDGLYIKVLSKNHLEMLHGKYYRTESNPEWILLDKDKCSNLISSQIFIRSAMTCQSKHFRICKKCFGEKNIKSKYVGIVAGQSLTERLTQLTMQTFHTSGSAKLEISEFRNEIKFITEHLIDISMKLEDVNKYKTFLHFDTDVDPCLFNKIDGFDNILGNVVQFNTVDNIIENVDVITTIRNVKELIKSQSKVEKEPSQYYMEMVEYMLNVGIIYSSYIEILFANMFMTGETDFWRYNRSDPITWKLGDKTLAMKISPLLGLLYQPNSQTIQKVNYQEFFYEDMENRSIYEKIWLGQY